MDLEFNLLLRNYLAYALQRCNSNPPPTDLPMHPENMPYYHGPRIQEPTDTTVPTNELHIQSLIAVLSHPTAMGILTCQISPFDLAHLMVQVPSQDKRREPFSTQNLQATLDRHSSLTGQFIHFQMDILC
jgi:hypothetical protein